MNNTEKKNIISKEKIKNKKKWIIIAIAIFVILVFPIRFILKDGGSVIYKSLIYEITNYHQLNSDYSSGYKNGISIKLFGFLIFEIIEKPNVENERIIKINDKLYYEVKEEEENISYCNDEIYDGEITQHIENMKIPTNNNESNFNEDLKYIFVNNEVIKTCPNNSTTLYFKTKEKPTHDDINIEDGELDIHSDLVLDLYQKVNPSEDATILKDFYQNQTFSNSYIITVGLFNLILEKEIKDTEEYINANEVKDEIQNIFGNVSFHHQDVFLHSKNIFGKGICGYEYQSNSNLYQLKHGCDGNANEFFRRKLVNAEKCK